METGKSYLSEVIRSRKFFRPLFAKLHYVIINYTIVTAISNKLFVTYHISFFKDRGIKARGG